MVRKRKAVAKVQSFSGSHLTLAVFGGLAFIGFMQFMSPAQREIRQLKTESRLSDLRAQSEAKIANERYQGACIMPHVYVGANPNWYPKATVIAEGKPVLTGATQTAVVEGATVCDDRGLTAVIINGVPVNAAKSNDAKLINQRFEDALGWHERAQRSDVFVGESYVQN